MAEWCTRAQHLLKHQDGTADEYEFLNNLASACSLTKTNGCVSYSAPSDMPHSCLFDSVDPNPGRLLSFPKAY